MSLKSSASAKPLTAMIALALICLTLSGCVLRSQVVTEYRTVEVEVERLIPIDPALTQPQPPPDMDVVTWLDAVVLGIHYRHRWESCEARLKAIRSAQ